MIEREHAVNLGYHLLIARVAKGRETSLHINCEFRFELVGTMKEAGRRFGRLLNVYVM